MADRPGDTLPPSVSGQILRELLVQGQRLGTVDSKLTDTREQVIEVQTTLKEERRHRDRRCDEAARRIGRLERGSVSQGRLLARHKVLWAVLGVAVGSLGAGLVRLIMQPLSGS